jgi:hypothetical protein
VGESGETELSAKVSFPASPHTQHAAIPAVTKNVPDPPLRKHLHTAGAAPVSSGDAFMYAIHNIDNINKRLPPRKKLPEQQSNNVVNRPYVT